MRSGLKLARSKKGSGDYIPRRSVGNRKERLRDYASSLDQQPNVPHRIFVVHLLQSQISLTTSR